MKYQQLNSQIHHRVQQEYSRHFVNEHKLPHMTIALRIKIECQKDVLEFEVSIMC